jgi:hypothetical protein
MALIIAKYPQLASAAIEAYYLRDPVDMQVSGFYIYVAAKE